MNCIDFTPQWYRDQLRTKQNRRRRLGYILAICMLMVCWLVISEGRIQQASATLRITHSMSEQSQLLSARLHDLREQREALRRELQHYDKLANYVPPSMIFAEISHRIPDHACLVDFTLEPFAEAARHGKSTNRRQNKQSRKPAKHEQFSDQIATLTIRAASSEVMLQFVRNLQDSPLVTELRQKGMTPIHLMGTPIKQKTLQLLILSAECIGP